MSLKTQTKTRSKFNVKPVQYFINDQCNLTYDRNKIFITVMKTMDWKTFKSADREI